MKQTQLITFFVVLEFITLLYFINLKPKSNISEPTLVPRIRNEQCVSCNGLASNNSGKGVFNYEEWHLDPNKPKKTIKVKFVDSWEREPTNKNPDCFICKYLSKVYNLDFTDKPDFFFTHSWGKSI